MEEEKIYKIAIFDDDKYYVEYLKNVIEKTNAVDRKSLFFYDFYSGEQLLLCPKWDFDLVILDMWMNTMDGYETAMKLRKIDSHFVLVFCSGVVNPVSQFFKAHPFRYLLKSYSDEEMVNEMAEILNEMMKETYPYVLCKLDSKEEQIRVYPEAILYISIRHKNCEIYTWGKLKECYQGETLKVKMNLNSLEKIFDENCGFVRVHYSYIVNMAYIIFIDPRKIKLIDGTELNISRTRSKEFNQIFARFMAAKYKEWE